MTTCLRWRMSAVSFGGVRAVRRVASRCDRGEIFAIIGPNGAGKTTLFNVDFRALCRPQRGHVALDGRGRHRVAAASSRARGMSRTFQNLQIFFRMTAAENVMVGRHLHEDRDVLAHLLALALGAAAKPADAHRRPTNFSHSSVSPRGRQAGGKSALRRAQAAGDRARARDRAEGAAARRAGGGLQSGRDRRDRRRDPEISQAVASRSCWSSTTCGW